MNIQKGKLTMVLLDMGYLCFEVDMILSCVSASGQYNDAKMFIVADIENGGYIIENTKLFKLGRYLN